MVLPSNNDDSIRSLLLAKIDDRGKHWTKVKTLMSHFGFQASTRVRQTSLNEVLRSLDDWGIAYAYDGLGANDYVTLTRRAGDVGAKTRTPSVAPPPADEPWRPTLNPLHFAFRVGSDRDEARAEAQAHDVLAAVWSFRPVCLMVCGDDESFAFLGGLLSALMRRRALMVRTTFSSDSSPTAPDILTLSQLQRIAGRSDAPQDGGMAFPNFGSVYLVRDDPADARDDELVAMLRELFVPHTYRVDARFGSLDAADANGKTEPRRPADSAEFPALVKWLCAFAGGRGLASHLAPIDTLDLATLLADAAQIHGVLLDRSVLDKTDPSFRAGFESTEHMAIKNVMIGHLRGLYPGEKVLVEEQSDAADEDISGMASLAAPEKRTRQARRPDVWIPRKVWVEVETLRSIAIRGSNPFFDLERKMRQRVEEMSRDGAEVWLLVPSDVAALASAQLAAVARNLVEAGLSHFRWGFVDLERRVPVFVDAMAPTPPRPNITGASWRDRVKPSQPSKLTWDDVAGYSDVRQRLTTDVLSPLVDRKRYEEHDLGPANGLLLFGLPGCGKSLVGRVLAGEAHLTCRLIVPSDLTSAWLGEGVGKIRELFDWALKQRSCLLVIDEIDAVAPQRQEHNMHSDEKRQVNELLAQLDRISGKSVMVVATTNYLRGIDGAIRRAGRFDVKLPVYPPDEADRKAIFDHYLGRLKNFELRADTAVLARETRLFTPADIKTVVQAAARRAVGMTENSACPAISTLGLAQTLRNHARAIQRDMAEEWIAEARQELGAPEKERLDWLAAEVRAVYPS